MTKNQDRQVIAELIKDAIFHYDALIGKTFMYVFDNRCIEVVFRKQDFKHLTGVGVSLSAKQFYKNVKQGHLSGNQIYFGHGHYYDLAIRKVAFLASLPLLTNSSILILEDLVTIEQRIN